MEGIAFIFILVTILGGIIAITISRNNQKEAEKRKYVANLKKIGLSESDIIYIGTYVGGKYALPFNSECFFQNGYIKFATVKNTPDSRFTIKLTDITSVLALWYFDLSDVVPKEEILWRKKDLQTMNNFLLIDYLENEQVIHTVFEIASGIDRDNICDKIKEQVDLARKQQSNEFWEKQSEEVQKIRIKSSHEATISSKGSKQDSFVAIDFEHATPYKGSVCSVGIATVIDGEIIDSYTTLIQPPNNEYFLANSLIHGIYETDTINSPTFSEVWPEIKQRIDNKTIIAHGANHTDRHCLKQAMEINNINDSIDIRWIDTQEICNAKLDIISKVCNLELDHHNALSDAIACAKVYLLHLSNNLPFEKIYDYKGKEKQNNIASLKAGHIPISGELLFPEFDSVTNKNNPFYKKKVVISGLYDLWPDRKELAAQLKRLGADIDGSVGKYTNILCVGFGCGMSKREKMQELIDAGKDAKILNEQEIITLLKQCGELDN